MRRPLSILCTAVLAVLFSTSILVAGGESPPAQGRVLERSGAVLPQRLRIEPVNRMLRERLEKLLPEMMRQAGIVITPGVTNTEDVAGYIRQRFADLDLAVRFMPSVNLQRP